MPRGMGSSTFKPEIALLHKAHLMRQKDEADFSSLLPALDDRARGWLDNALALYLPGPGVARPTLNGGRPVSGGSPRNAARRLAVSV
jgi:hypothetical protein